MVDPIGNPEVDSAVRDPADYFEFPIDVVRDPRFTKEEKRRILESWALDAQLLSRAEDENMPGEDPPLQEVKLALLELRKQT